MMEHMVVLVQTRMLVEQPIKQELVQPYKRMLMEQVNKTWPFMGWGNNKHLSRQYRRVLRNEDEVDELKLTNY